MRDGGPQPQDPTESESPEWVMPADEQTFLVGASVYLRPFTHEDATWWPAWRQSLFPWTKEHAAEWLSEAIQPMGEGDEIWMLAARRSDDEPIGAVLVGKWDFRAANVSIQVRRALAEEDRLAIWAELVRLVIPWLHEERDQMVVWLSVPIPAHPVVAAALRDVGQRPVVGLREFRYVAGKREHWWLYESLHPAWVARLGDPYEAPAPPPAVGQREPAPVTFRQRPVTLDELRGPFPARAAMVGPRVYLRGLEAEDADVISYWSRREQESAHTNGRSLRSPIAHAAHIQETTKPSPPEWIRFGICLREDDTLIGTCGVLDLNWVHRTGETESDIFDPSQRGGGLGTEAKHLLLDYCFDHLGLHAVNSYVWAFNPRSQAALGKQGYRRAGRMHWATIRHGAFQHDDLFDLLAEEWQMARELARRQG